MRSSYISNCYGEVFQRLIYAYTPNKCVELGVLDGYSALHIAKGLLHAKNTKEHRAVLNCYDLWDDYEYNHGNKSDVERMLSDNGVREFVNLYKQDAYTVHESYADVSVCFVHVDISNTGEVLRRMVELWYPKLTFGGMIVFEGGSEERDNVEWMVKYNKPKIKPELETNELINSKFMYCTYYPFPSLTIMIKKQ